ncbi:MCP four helix bundle domain-containing protein, partial [Methylobacterium sp. CG09_land_8_20_14_0_10_71_15]|uniref:MCP four helix bundle domain-containing protein n=5 Tax=Pseudomonadota TaxID=1224 RepID=UPI00257A5E65
MRSRIECPVGNETMTVLDRPFRKGISLKATLMALFGFMALIAAGQGALTLIKLSSIRQSVNEVATNWMPSVVAVNEIRARIAEVRIKQYRFVTGSSDGNKIASSRQQYEAALQSLEQARKRYEPMISSAEERGLYERFGGSWAAYKKTSDHLADLVEAGRMQEAFTELAKAETVKIYTDVTEALAQNASLNERSAQQDADRSVVNADSAAWMAYAAVAIATVCGVCAMVFALFRVSRPIEAMTGAMDRLASGDVGVSIPGSGRRDEIGAMAGAVQVFKDNLIRSRALEEEASLARAGAEAQRKAAMREMADGFEAAVGGIIGTVTSAATELQATAQTMTATATQTASQSTTVAAAAEE